MKRSAGILFFRRSAQGVEVLLIHPGGPYWSNKDVGSWQIPKGLIGPGESAVDAARRETEEELGIRLDGAPVPLAKIRQAGGKVVEAFALEQDIDPDTIRSNTFELEWPPRSGRLVAFPEVDAARWLTLQEAETVVLKSQLPLVAALRSLLAA